jgi:hypothetical protein
MVFPEEINAYQTMSHRGVTFFTSQACRYYLHVMSEILAFFDEMEIAVHRLNQGKCKTIKAGSKTS